VRMTALCSSETSVSSYLRTQCQTPEDQNLNCHREIMSDVTQIQEDLRKHIFQCLHVYKKTSVTDALTKKTVYVCTSHMSAMFIRITISILAGISKQD
jgi:hypothetical protein